MVAGDLIAARNWLAITDLAVQTIAAAAGQGE